MPKRTKEKEKGPKPYEIILGGILSVILGVLLGALFLMVQPVEEVEEGLSDELQRLEMRAMGERWKGYYQPGELGVAAQVDWMGRRNILLGGTAETLEVSEEELNRWALSEFEGLEDNGDNADESGWQPSVRPGVPNFRIDDGVLYIHLDLQWNGLGVERVVKSQAHGTFTERDGRFVFQPEVIYVGGFKFPYAAWGEGLIRRVVDAFEVSDELLEAWGRLSDVYIEEDRLVLHIP